MCGISGFYYTDFLKRNEIENQIYLMNETINHRGPDNSGYWINQNNSVALGHQRLSIIDLSDAGSQPMISNSGRYVITFNGEIYNHKTIRKKLNNTGNNISWKGYSDTETVINAIEIWGLEKTLSEIIGMFAFAVFDKSNKSLILARDRIGEKPLYYGLINNNFVFGSELKVICKFKKFTSEIDGDSLNLFLKYGYIPSPNSIYKGIKKLTQGSYLIVNLKNSKTLTIKNNSYWDLKNVIDKGKNNLFNGNLDEAVIELENLLQKTISQQMASDVDLGAFLSGGVDSSLVTALMQKINIKKIKTFSIGFENKLYNEAIYAKKVSAILGTDHHEFYISQNDALNVIPNISDIYDEPFADSSQIPTIILSKLTRQFVKVALSGDGGDEIFGGYNRYIWFETIYKYTKWINYDIRRIISEKSKFIGSNFSNKVINSIESISPKTGINNFANKLLKLTEIIDYRDINDLYEKIISIIYDVKQCSNQSFQTTKEENNYFGKFNENFSSLMAIDTLTYLPDDILVKVDRAAMSVGLETRIPFLDKRIIDFAWSLPVNMKINKKNKKLILKKILSRYIPNELIERPKQGFGIPLSNWLRGPLKNWAEDLLSIDCLNKYSYLDVDYVRNIWEDHLKGKRNNQYLLWNVLMFQSWMENSKF